MYNTELEQRTIAVIDEWIDDLNNYSMEQLLQQPAEKSWSIGQVYIHLWMAAKGFFFKNVERIVSNDERVKLNGKKNLGGWIVFAFGRMPALKIEMPGSVAVQPRQPESKEQIVSKLTEIKSLLSDNIARLKNVQPNAKTKHPFLGYLSAEEWIKLCAIHFNHHKAQKRRVKKHFGWQ